MRAARVAAQVLLAPPLLLGASLCAGAAVAAQFGRRDLEFDILTHFAPFWLVGGLACGLAALLVLRGVTRAVIASMGLVAVAASGALILPELLRDTGPRAPPTASDTLKVVQLNVWVRAGEPTPLVDWIKSQDADIVIAEETYPAFRRAMRRRTDFHVTCGSCEVVIYSRRRPLAGVRARFEPAPLSRAAFRDARGRYDVIGVHYAWPTDIADQQRQEARLARMIATTDRRRTIVAGDFNSTPWSFSRRRWDARFGLIRRDRALFSWPAQKYRPLPGLGLFAFLPIDHVYAGSDWATVSVRRGPRLPSDHYPVIMTLAPVARR